MYRMPEKQSGSQAVLDCTRSCFYQYANNLSNHILSIELKYPDLFLPLFDLLRFILNFVQAEFFHANLLFQKEKNSRKRCVYNHGNSYLFHFTYTYMQITVYPPDFTGDKNVDFEFPDACLFGHPFYFGYQDFIG